MDKDADALFEERGTEGSDVSSAVDPADNDAERVSYPATIKDDGDGDVSRVTETPPARYTPVDKFPRSDSDELEDKGRDDDDEENIKHQTDEIPTALSEKSSPSPGSIPEPSPEEVVEAAVNALGTLERPSLTPSVDDGQSDVDGGDVDDGPPPRLLLISSRIKNISSIQSAMLANVFRVTFKHDLGPDEILSLIAEQLGTTKVESIAFIVPSTTTTIQVYGKEDSCFLTKESILEVKSLRGFFEMLARNHLDSSWVNARLDFLHCATALTVDGNLIAEEIRSLVNVPVGISKDINGSDISYNRIGDETREAAQVGDLYFNVTMLRSWSAHQQSLSGFEKIRAVGKGAYGTAVLYRKKDDDSLVILKEINMCDLNAGERQMALNEVRVLAMLDHPNIIGYYDTFEEDGTMMIEMEYADGGTLAQFLSTLEEAGPMSEKEILAMYSQIVGAIRHMHEHKILHRDLKTSNIFMTKEGIIKVGDFGISKMMTTNGASTVLGTPYYISPEICEGKAYNEKSDIWSLGCILYEMACLQKTFEGSNLPALVNKIVKGQFAPIKGEYSQGFRTLIRDMLQKDPEFRPTATDLLYLRIPELQIPYLDPVTDGEDDLTQSASESGGSSGVTKKKQTRSELYCIDMGSLWLTGIELPQRISVRELSSGSNHCVIVSSEHLVFSWGRNHKGQLGVGDLDDRVNPTQVEALRGKTIVRGACGSNFSVFISDNGIVMTCGDGTTGCLGHGDWNCITKPKLIEAILSVDVTALACGPHHVAVIGSNGEIYTWGTGAKGRLGHGTEEDKSTPNQITVEEPVLIKDVFCGVDGTMFLTDAGAVFACGHNEFNKLGLNNRQGFLMTLKQIFNQREVEGSLKPICVRSLMRHRVENISMGPKHSAVLDDRGTIVTLGNNEYAQLGLGNTKPQSYPTAVRGLSSKMMTDVYCEQSFTIGWTTEELFFWGGKPKSRKGQLKSSQSTSFEPPTPVPESVNGFHLGGEEESIHVVVTMNENCADPTNAKSLDSKPETEWNDSPSIDVQGLSVVTHPSLFLKLSALKNDALDETILLTDVVCMGHFLYILVETSILTSKEGTTNRRIRNKVNRRMRKRITLPNCAKNLPEDKVERVPPSIVAIAEEDGTSASESDGKADLEKPNHHNDSTSNLPAWIKQELESSEEIRKNGRKNEPVSTLAQSKDSQSESMDNLSSDVHSSTMTEQMSQESEVVDDGTMIQDVEYGDLFNPAQFPSIYATDGAAFKDALPLGGDILSSSSGSEVGIATGIRAMAKDHSRTKVAFSDHKVKSKEKQTLFDQKVEAMNDIYKYPKPSKKTPRQNAKNPSEKPSKGLHPGAHAKTKPPSVPRGSAGKPTTESKESRSGGGGGGGGKRDNKLSQSSESPPISRKFYQEMEERLVRVEAEKKEMEDRLKRIEAERALSAATERENNEHKLRRAKTVEESLQEEVVTLRNELKDQANEWEQKLLQLQSQLQDQMLRYQTEQLRMERARRVGMTDSTLGDSSSSGERPVTVESGYSTGKKRRGPNRVTPEAGAKNKDSRVCSVQ